MISSFSSLQSLTAGLYRLDVHTLENPNCVTSVLAQVYLPSNIIIIIIVIAVAYLLIILGLNATASITNLQCAGSSSGIITVTPTGGTAPYSYDFRTIGDVVVTSSDNTASNLVAGTYYVIITDSYGCSFRYDGLSVSAPQGTDNV